MEKIKLFMKSDRGRDIMVVLIVILVGLGSFELGRLSVKGQNTSIQVQYPAELKSGTSQSASLILGTDSSNNTPKFSPQTVHVVSAPAVENEKVFFASKRGHKYYSLGCSAGKTIKMENRIYFNSASAAESAGYTLASSCN